MVARRPFEAARQPRPGSGRRPRRASAHRSAAARRGAAPAAPGRRARALAPGACASERAAAAVAHVARAGQRAPSPADGSRGLGRPARNVPRRPPATRSRRGWRAPGRRGAGGAVRGDAGAAWRPGAPPTAAPAPAAARAPDIARIAKREGCVRGVFAAVQASHPSQACWPSIARAPSMNGAGVGALRRSKGGNVRNRGHAIGYRIINYSPGVRPTGGPPQT